MGVEKEAKDSRRRGMLMPGRKVVVGVPKEVPGVDCLTKAPWKLKASCTLSLV